MNNFVNEMLDGVVADAVTFGPISIAISLITGNFTGKMSVFGLKRT